ncbi:prolipoprotein diacylglyceryl transferase [Halorarum salinum]|uniref:Uncharacterized protein n=1 Tax=Halorarum salinum TaxID=2743089 RepID=A0A7D5QD83_9EURY|nr:hypothetical protein [Halobaculum salinum]QLG64257.1 hypothetical protein HUG12_20970 [Halobaculum salinum]
MRSTAGTVLTPERKEIIARSVSVALREGLKEAAREPEEEERSESSRGGRRSRVLLLAAVGTAIRFLLRRRGRSGSADGSEATTGGRSVPVESGESVEGAGSTGRSGGRRLLSMVVRLGAIVAVAYALARRYGSRGVEDAITDASERTRAIADRTASRAGKAAYKVDSISEEVADRIEERGGEAADRMEERGEETAERMEEVAETTEGMAGADEDEGTAEEAESEGGTEADEEDEQGEASEGSEESEGAEAGDGTDEE